jgi:hypothetical protein
MANRKRTKQNITQKTKDPATPTPLKTGKDCLTSYWLIIFNIRNCWLILTLSLGKIKGEMSKLPIRNLIVETIFV